MRVRKRINRAEAIYRELDAIASEYGRSSNEVYSIYFKRGYGSIDLVRSYYKFFALAKELYPDADDRMLHKAIQLNDDVRDKFGSGDLLMQIKTMMFIKEFKND